MGVAAGKGYATGWAQTHGGEQANSCQDCVFNLGQNPRVRRSQSTSAGECPTLTKAAGVLWIPHLGRWMVPLELAAASGFPATPILAQAAQLPGGVTAHIAKSHVGNVMQLPNVGCVLATALATLAPM